jgi:hypothetical protein
MTALWLEGLTLMPPPSRLCTVSCESEFRPEGSSGRHFDSENAFTGLLRLWVTLDASARETRVGEQLRDLIALVEVKHVSWRLASLPLMERTNCDGKDAALPQHTSDFAQTRRRVPPKVDAVHRKCAIKRIVGVMK